MFSAGFIILLFYLNELKNGPVGHKETVPGGQARALQLVPGRAWIRAHCPQNNIINIVILDSCPKIDKQNKFRRGRLVFFGFVW